MGLICAVCDEPIINENEAYYSSKLDAYVHEGCYYSELDYPMGVVKIFKPKEKVVETYVVTSVEDRKFVLEIDDISEYDGDYGELDDTDEISPRQFKWVPLGPWRGYYAPDTEDWVEIHEDCYLAGSRDAEDLKNFNYAIMRFLWKLGVEFAIVTARTSNLFSAGYDLLIPKDVAKDFEKMMQIVSKLAELKYHYRDPVRFILTAITGKDEFDEKDYILLDIWERIRSGEDVNVEEYISRLIAGGVNAEAATEEI